MNAADENVLFSWETVFSLMTNRFFLYDMVKFFAWTFVSVTVFLAIMFGLVGNLAGLGHFFPIVASTLGGLFVLTIGISLVVLGNRYPIRYTLTDRALLWQDLSRAGRKASRLAILLGALSGSPAAAGAGLLSKSQETGKILWKDVRLFKEHPQQGVISVKNSWRVVIRLYCTTDNYASVAETLRRLAAQKKSRDGL